MTTFRVFLILRIVTLLGNFQSSFAFVPSRNPFGVTPSSITPPHNKEHSDLQVSASAAWTASSPANATGYSFQDFSDATNVAQFQTRTKQRSRQRTRTQTRQEQFQIYCDLDGVLVDFEAGIRSIFPEHALTTVTSFHIPDLKRSTMWQRVQQADSFFARLPWTTDGKRLWKAIQPYQPTILTGVPEHKSSRQEKLTWCERELGVQVHHTDMAGRWWSHAHVNDGKKKKLPAGVTNVITCWSDNKHHECQGPNSVLIDDRDFLRNGWERKGGIFIHHDGNVDRTLSKLRDYGIVRDDDDDDDDDYELHP